MFLSCENGSTEHDEREATRVNLVLAAAPGTDQSVPARVAHEIRELYDAHLMSAHAGGENVHQFEGLRVAHTVGGGGPSAHMLLHNVHVFLYTLSHGDSLRSIVQEKTESWMVAARCLSAKGPSFSQLLDDQRVHAVFYFLDPLESEMHRSDEITRELDAVAQVATIIPVLVGTAQDDGTQWQGRRQQALEFFRMVHDVARNRRTSVWARPVLPEGAVLCGAAHQGNGPNAVAPSDILEVLQNSIAEQQLQAFSDEELIHCTDVFDLCTDVDTLHKLLSIADTKCSRRCSPKRSWTSQLCNRKLWPVYLLLLYGLFVLFLQVGQMCGFIGLGEHIGHCMAVTTQQWVYPPQPRCPPQPACPPQPDCPPQPACPPRPDCPPQPDCPDRIFSSTLEACRREGQEALDQCEGQLAQARNTAKHVRTESEQTCDERLNRMSQQAAEQIARGDEQLRKCKQGL